MLLLIAKIILGTIWGTSSLMIASMFAALFAPEKEQLLLRSFYVLLLLVPALILVPLSFAAFTLVLASVVILISTIVSLKGTAELIIHGIPEMEEHANLDPITKASGVNRDE
tara:strand:- start:3940 stop:4275 length:336 start_codon:yes stop_codon:yes gene_type:complete